MLEMLKAKCLQLKDKNPEKYELINELLSDDECFFKMSSETAINILLDLEFSIEEARKIYLNLIKKESL